MAPAIDLCLSHAIRVRRWVHEGEAHRWPEGAHAAHEIACVEVGRVSYRIGSRTIEVAAGEAIFVPFAHGHQTSIDQGTRAVSLWLGAEMIAELADAMGTRPYADAIALARSEQRATIASLMAVEAARDARGRAMVLSSLAEAVAVEALRGAATRNTHARDPRIARALEKIESDYAEAIGVEELAKAAGMSRFHFSRLFHEQVGKSPYQHLVATRIERARELLSSGRANVTEAALSVGFAELSRFSKAFKERYGESPAALRARAIERKSA